MPNKPKTVAVVGPTASGKTSLSINIAEYFGGEVISADSRQIYRGMDIGTSKVTKEEMRGIPHHLIDIADPKDVYTAASFSRDARATIERVLKRGQLPIIAGGSFFYLDLLRGRQLPAPVPPNEELRKELEVIPTDELLETLQKLDPERAHIIDPHNRRRLIRSLEIIEAMGHIPKPEVEESPYDWVIIGLETEKEVLLKKFADRIDKWLKNGLQEEVENLMKNGVTRERLKEHGFEYTLMLSYMDNELDKEQLVEKFIQKNWQYAKRQMTWLKRDQEIEWYKPEDRAAIFRRVEEFLGE